MKGLKILRCVELSYSPNLGVWKFGGSTSLLERGEMGDGCPAGRLPGL